MGRGQKKARGGRGEAFPSPLSRVEETTRSLAEPFSFRYHFPWICLLHTISRIELDLLMLSVSGKQLCEYLRSNLAFPSKCDSQVIDIDVLLQNIEMYRTKMQKQISHKTQ